MTARLHIGVSTREATAEAVSEAVGAALRDAANPALAVVLATESCPDEPLATALASQLGSLPWIGISAAGVFAGTRILRQGLAVGVLSSPGAYVGVGAAGPVSGNPRAAGAAAVARALDQMPGPAPSRGRAVLLFLNPTSGHGAEVVRGAVHEGGMGLCYAGGGTGDPSRSSRTTQFARGRAFADHAVAAAIDLPGRFGSGTRHGWRPYGPPTMVTRARGFHALELEYENPFEVYRRTAAQRGDEVTRENFAAFAALHPLGIPQADGDHLLRSPSRVEDDGTLRCVAEVPDGSLVRVMEASREDLLLAARDAARSARESAGGPLAGALVFESIARPLLLQEAFAEELAAAQEGLGPDVPLLGCLTLGEVGTLGPGVAQFHNKALTVLAIPG